MAYLVIGLSSFVIGVNVGFLAANLWSAHFGASSRAPILTRETAFGAAARDPGNPFPNQPTGENHG